MKFITIILFILLSPIVGLLYLIPQFREADKQHTEFSRENDE